MPHIEPGDRKKFVFVGTPETVGELTYALTLPIRAFLKSREKRFSTYAMVLGAISSLRADFHDNVVGPYEKQKAEENGNAWRD